MREIKNIGLRGISVADTKISAVDGERGKLLYRGYNIEELAEHSTFEEVAYLLLYETLPAEEELGIFTDLLTSERQLPAEIIRHLKNRKKTAYPMDVLQSVIPMLADFDEEARIETREANMGKSIRLIARVATLVAYWERIRKNLDIKKPDKRLGIAANFLYMLTGETPDMQIARYFDICLILHADHSFNTSTFTAREVASTRAHMYACVSAALGALSGELHGGANTEVMKMLLEIDNVDKVEEWVNTRLDAGERIMGMGHAVYRIMDPRAKILRDISEKLAQRTGDTRWFDLSKKVEDVVRSELIKRKGKDMYPNIDLYSAPVFYMMGIDPDLFTPVFAASRVSGWCAHIIEEKFAQAQPEPALYRPEADYIGRYCGPQECRYVPVEKR